MDADAVSRLLQYGEESYVNMEDELRDDFGPLKILKWDHHRAIEMITKVINRHREERREQLEIMKAKEARELAEKILKRKATPRTNKIGLNTVRLKKIISEVNSTGG
jgi:hypothetical protein